MAAIVPKPIALENLITRINARSSANLSLSVIAGPTFQARAGLSNHPAVLGRPAPRGPPTSGSPASRLFPHRNDFDHGRGYEEGGSVARPAPPLVFKFPLLGFADQAPLDECGEVVGKERVRPLPKRRARSGSANDRPDVCNLKTAPDQHPGYLRADVRVASAAAPRPGDHLKDFLENLAVRGAPDALVIKIILHHESSALSQRSRHSRNHGFWPLYKAQDPAGIGAVECTL